MSRSQSEHRDRYHAALEQIQLAALRSEPEIDRLRRIDEIASEALGAAQESRTDAESAGSGPGTTRPVESRKRAGGAEHPIGPAACAAPSEGAYERGLRDGAAQERARRLKVRLHLPVPERLHHRGRGERGGNPPSGVGPMTIHSVFCRDCGGWVAPVVVKQGSEHSGRIECSACGEVVVSVRGSLPAAEIEGE